MDVVQFCSGLINCCSVTPTNDGAIEYIASFLQQRGFQTKILEFSEGENHVKNLFAKISRGQGKNLGFLGHSDVVPAGDGWDTPPFSATIVGDHLVGRGVTDMKGGISAFCVAVDKFLAEKNFEGSISFFITGDEEIGTYQGILSVLDWAVQNREIPDDCLIGEPSSFEKVGDRIYIGHRGSINARLIAKGKQGHVAQPKSFDNSLLKICQCITQMKAFQWKHNELRFPPTNLEPTLLYTGNYAENVVPGESSANVNVRFSADYSSEEIKEILSSIANQFGISIEFRVNGEAYCCDDENLKNKLSRAIERVAGISPKFSAAGGTSDGRHMIKYCNVIEFGVQDSTMHQSNECCKTADLEILQNIYYEFLKNYFECD